MATTLLVPDALLHAGDTNLEEQVQLLHKQNVILQQQLQQQGLSLDALTQKVEDLEAAKAEGKNIVSENSEPVKNGFSLGNVALSGEGGAGFNKTGPDGFAPNSEFRVNDARLFIETPIWKEVYFYSEVDLTTPESTSIQTGLGELYVDFENASQLWGRDDQLNVRLGRMNVPFGEEYLSRYSIDNPLILNSVSDLWGVDPGVEIYGALGKFSYCIATQNGGGNGVQDDNDDKSVAGRIGYDLNAHWHFSVSGMRTGNIDANGLSEEWFGNGFFQSIGSASTTTFNINAVELDTTVRWSSGYIRAFGGYARYGDNDPLHNNGRSIFYYSGEVLQNLPKRFYAVMRFSEANSEKGYPIVGNGSSSNYFSKLTTGLWRLSLGLGYRFSDRLIIKSEYAFEGGYTADGESRNNENYFGTEVVFKY